MAKIISGDPRDPRAEALLRQHHALMQSLFPAEANHFLSVDALCAQMILHALLLHHARPPLPDGCARSCGRMDRRRELTRTRAEEDAVRCES